MSDDILHTGRADIHHPKGPLTAQQPLSPSEEAHEREVLSVIAERDRAEEWADRLAAAIGDAAGVEIGEHSNMNSPWANALEAARALAVDLPAHVARVRAAVAEDLWREAQRIRAEDWPGKVGIEYVNGFEAAVGWVEQHAAASSVRPDTDRTPDVGTPEHPQRFWWHHDDCDSGPVAGAADWPGRPCTGCGMSLGGWTRGAPIAAGSVPSLPEETPDAR